MKYIILSMALLLCACNNTNIYSHARTYSDSINAYREQYKRAFTTDDNSPLKAADTAYLRFYAPDKHYCLIASFVRTQKADTFEMPTHSGKTKKYQEYGRATFILDSQQCTLHIYQSIALIVKDAKYKDYLFVPFNDATNYTETFGGGRYLDLTTDDIQNNKVTLDFNKCYNPYCAYANGYSCPIPPAANRLNIAIKAGEKLFGHVTK